MSTGKIMFLESIWHSAMLMMLVFCIVYSTLEAKGAPLILKTKFMFEYLPLLDLMREVIVSDKPMSRGISNIKSSMAINITGQMNAETNHIMTLRKCGVEGRIGPSRMRRLKRYALHTSWGHKNLTYKISKYSKKLDRITVDEEISKALAVWSEYTDLSFTPASGTVDIEIRFERGAHGDGKPFDGREGEILAHAFYPWFGGDVHFDEDEEWTIGSDDGTNLFQVAVHEFGHSLGLGHSRIKFAVMAREYKSYDPNFVLDKDDIKGIQAIYGPKTIEGVPQLCTDPRVDTIFKTPRGHIYAFRGKYYWKLNTDGIAVGFPKLIGRRWNRLPGNIDAAVTHKNGNTFFFKGSKYWKYVGERMDGDYPREIDVGFSKAPKNLLAQFKLSIQTNRHESSSAMRNWCSSYRITDISGQITAQENIE